MCLESTKQQAVCTQVLGLSFS